MTTHIHIVDDHPGAAEAMGEVLEDAGHTCQVFLSGEDALAAMQARPPDVLVTDLRMEGLDGIQLLREARLVDPGLPVILVTAHGTIDKAIEATNLGAFAFVTKPVQPHEIVLHVRNALALRTLERASTRRASKIVGRSVGVLRALTLADRAATAEFPVLITGESGTGKELLARRIHEGSAQANRPFVAVNCGAIPESLIEAELFGHVRGAFTGADRDRAGLVDEADGGTFFLDEVGELTPASQVRLLRFLQEGTYRRVGDSRERHAKVRVIAATHRDLRSSDMFREDLFFRLSVVPIELPPLRARGDDVVILLGTAVAKACEAMNRPVMRFTSGALEALRTYGWPGNVRELLNLADRLALLTDAQTVDLGDLPPEISGSRGDPDALRLPHGDFALTGWLESLEERALRRAMDRNDNVQTRAAASLGLERNAFRYKLTKYGILG